ncbi:MAG: hypothetical protein U0995_08945 [Erythrobacter sp.]|nr:hypothetical protein [Erythrobacter sp.]
MKWALIFIIYIAPDDAVDWDGPWEIGMIEASENYFDSAAECRNEGIAVKGRVQQGILAPIRFHCVPVEGGLPKGAIR